MKRSRTTIAVAPGATLRPNFSGRILVVDDDRDIRSLFSRILRRNGAEVDLAEDGTAAIIQAMAAHRSPHPFGLILMDVEMPGLDGCTTARTLRSAGFAEPIVAITSDDRPATRDRCCQAGYNQYKTKPMKSDALLSLAAHYLSDKSSLS